MCAWFVDPGGWLRRDLGGALLRLAACSDAPITPANGIPSPRETANSSRSLEQVQRFYVDLTLEVVEQGLNFRGWPYRVHGRNAATIDVFGRHCDDTLGVLYLDAIYEDLANRIGGNIDRRRQGRRGTRHVRYFETVAIPGPDNADGFGRPPISVCLHDATEVLDEGPPPVGEPHIAATWRQSK